MAKSQEDSAQKSTLEERLFKGVISDSLSQYEVLLSELQNVDARVNGQLTLLHVAVRLGKLDWVEALLEKGADPYLTDGEDSDVVRVAREMCHTHPWDGNRKEILKLVRLVHAWYGARSDWRASGGHVSGRGTFSRSTGKMDALGILVSELLSLKCNITDDVTSRVEPRDIILQKLEESVTSLAEEWRSTKDVLGELKARLEGVTKEEVKESSGNEANSGLLCGDFALGDLPDNVRAMLRITQVLNPKDRSDARIRDMYIRLECTGAITSCLLSFLKSYGDVVRVRIDCGTHTIENMRSSLREHDGTPVSGRSYLSFADLGALTVYLGGSDFRIEEDICGDLARALAQMTMLLAFGNGGRPYADGDEQRENQFKRVLDEAEDMKESGKLDLYISLALRKTTRLAKEIYLISAVPVLVAKFGLVEGKSRLCQQVPSLLRYYEEHIVDKLLVVSTE